MRALFKGVGLALLISCALPVLAADCGEVIEARRPEIPFKPFELTEFTNPDTGHPVSGLNERIKIGVDDAGNPTFATVGETLSKLNETERSLNRWGYTVRPKNQSEQRLPQNLATFRNCIEKFEQQKADIEKKLRSGSLFDSFKKLVEEFKPNFGKAWEAWSNKVPTWEELRKAADDKDFQVYMPPVPPFVIKPPVVKTPELKPILKKRLFPIDVGDDGDLVHLFGEAAIEVKGSTTEANFAAWLQTDASILGNKIGEILLAKANGNSMRQDESNLYVTLRIAQKTVYQKNFKGVSLSKEEDVGNSHKFGVEWRFAIGPIPAKAEIGFQGGYGVKFNFNLWMLQASGSAKPYAYAKAYAQLGIDLIIAGGGIGGELLVLNLSLPLTATVYVDWPLNDAPRLKLNLAAAGQLEALSGRLYAFAYLWHPIPWPPFINKAQFDFTIFEWAGFKKSGNFFQYNASLGPEGMVATGDLTAEDVAEVNTANAVSALYALENTANKQGYEVIKAVTDDLSLPVTSSIPAKASYLKAVDGENERLYGAFMEELKPWLQ